MMSRIAAGVRALMGPAPVMCTSCSKTKCYSGWNPLQLCRSCFDAIPWISQVQCQQCGRAEACGDCRKQEDRHLMMNRSAVRYDEGMKELLGRYKYRGDERLQLVLGNMLIHAYRLYLLDAAFKKRGFDCIAYVPVSQERQAERGFNQAEQMAIVLARQVKLPVVSLLKRVRHTEKQSFKSRKERTDNLRGAFAVTPGCSSRLRTLTRSKSRKLRILLVDDVYTTGSTLEQCAYEIKKALPAAEIYGLCWAR